MEEQIEAVQRMQDYIAAHLTEELNIANIAASAAYSPWYARRLFLSYVGITPADYVRKLRLRASALLLRDSKISITDAAMRSGFESVDGFQRAFYREFGRNPMEYAKSPTPLSLYTPYGVKFTRIKRREENMAVNSIFLQVIEKPERRAIIKRGVSANDYFAYCEEVGCDVWGILTSIKSISGEPVCMWLPEKYITPGTGSYVQGTEVETDYAGVIPEGFEIIDLPAAKYLMFQGEPFAEENFMQAIENIWEAEKKYDPSAIGCKWDDSNPRIQLEPIGTRGYIELLPIK